MLHFKKNVTEIEGAGAGVVWNLGLECGCGVEFRVGVRVRVRVRVCFPTIRVRVWLQIQARFKVRVRVRVRLRIKTRREWRCGCCCKNWTAPKGNGLHHYVNLDHFRKLNKRKFERVLRVYEIVKLYNIFKIKYKLKEMLIFINTL